MVRKRDRSAVGWIAAALLMPLCLGSCILGSEFKIDGSLVDDECFRLFAASVCLDFDAGELQVSGMTASVDSGSHCKSITYLKLSGYVDSNDNGQEDEGEAIEEFEHQVAEDGGSDHVTVGSFAVDTPQDEGDVTLRVEVGRKDGPPGRYPLEIKDC